MSGLTLPAAWGLPPLTLPPVPDAVARLVAAQAACLAALAAALLLDIELSLSASDILVLAGLLVLEILLMQGMPGRFLISCAVFVFVTCLVAEADVVVFLWELDRMLFPLLFLLFLFIWANPAARSLGFRRIVIALAAMVMVEGPLLGLTVPGISDASISNPAVPSSGFILGAGAISLAAAWLCARIELARRLRFTARIAELRDALLLVGTTGGVLLAGLLIAAHVQQGLRRLVANTALESLAEVSGWIAGALALLVLLPTVWHLPHAACAALLRGRCTPKTVAEAFWFSIAVLALALFAELPGRFAPGAAFVMALAGAAAFIGVRLGLPPMEQAEGSALWIVLVGEPNAAARRLAQRVAAAWSNGPVSVLAPPTAAKLLGGAHLRQCAIEDRVASLFPERSAHLRDWDATLPEPAQWAGVPVRELYARGDLWADVLGRRLARDAAVLAIEPVAAGLRTYLVPVSNAATLQPGMDAERLARLSTDVLPTETETLDWVRRSTEGVPETAGRRILIIDSGSPDALSRKVAERLAGTRDPWGLVVQAWTVRFDPGRRYVPGTFAWHAHILGRRAVERAEVAPWRKRLLRLTASWIAPAWDGEYDVVVVEGSEKGRADARAVHLLRSAVEGGAVERLIAIRPPERQDNQTLTFAPENYAGEIRWPVGSTVESRAQAIAERLLAREFLPMASPAAPPVVPPAAPPVVSPPESPAPTLDSSTARTEATPGDDTARGRGDEAEAAPSQPRVWTRARIID